MTTASPVKVTLRGPFFEKVITREIEQAILEETIRKIDERLQRPGRTLGRIRNPILPGTLTLGGGVSLVITSTRHYPRTRGTKWQAKNVAIVKAMAPRVMRALARRIVASLGS